MELTLHAATVPRGAGVKLSLRHPHPPPHQTALPSRCTCPKQAQSRSHVPTAPPGLDPLRLSPPGSGSGALAVAVAAPHSGAHTSFTGRSCLPSCPISHPEDAAGACVTAGFSFWAPLLCLDLLATDMSRSRSTRLLIRSGFPPVVDWCKPSCGAAPSWCSVRRKRMEGALAWRALGRNWQPRSAIRGPAFSNICVVCSQRGVRSCPWGGHSVALAERGTHPGSAQNRPMLAPGSSRPDTFFLFTRNRSGNMG